MKDYPHINGSSKAPHEPCVAFCKYDGSNLRFEWSKKRGFYKFGTRTRLFDKNDPVFGEGIDLFLNKYSEDLSKIFTDNKDYRNRGEAIAFCEFFGNKSFAGLHVKEDPKTVILFDINIYKMGILGPKEFLENFGHLDVAEVVSYTNLNQEFINDIREGKIQFESKKPIKNPVWEGVVCKSGKSHGLWMVKIKTNAYRDALKNHYATDWLKYWE